MDQRDDSIDCGNSLRCIRIQPDRYDDVIVYWRNSFFADEPLIVASGLFKQNETHDKLDDKHKRFLLDVIEHNASCVIVDENQKIVGAALNMMIVQKDESRERNHRLNADNNPKKMLTSLLFKVDEKIDLFANYSVDELIDCRFLSVDRNCRGKGLANALVQQTIRIDQNAGFKIIKSTATGICSTKTFLNHGFEVLYEIPYSEIEKCIRPGPPHEAIKLMVKILE